MALARKAKATGVRLHVIRNRDLYVTRMYATLGETWRGWSRIFRGSLLKPRRVVAAMALLFVFSIGPWISLIGAVVGAWGWATIIWGLAVVSQQSVTLRFYPLLGAARWRAMSYFAGALMCLGILTDALFRELGIGGTTWQGTSYQAGADRSGVVKSNDESPAHVG